MAVRISLKCKYELEESTVENRNSFENDDNNPSGQSTVQVSGGSDQAYEPRAQKQKRRQLKQELEVVK
jgi:hypothetical protein